ncbi:MAG: hypothetical protein ACYCQI_13240 [Gammaproteobacteria bacterium]
MQKELTVEISRKTALLSQNVVILTNASVALFYMAKVNLLPNYTPSSILFMGAKLPRHATVERLPTSILLNTLSRLEWVEGLFARQEDLDQIIRYRNTDGKLKNDLDEQQFINWIRAIEENTAICDMENYHIGKGVFVPPDKLLAKNTFIPASGFIKLDPTPEEYACAMHCSALLDLNSKDKKIIGLIDPANWGGILDLVNHAPNLSELINFEFKSSAIKNTVATANLRSKIKFYQGYAIAGVEVIEDIVGGKYGKQLLWSYAQPDEYIIHNKNLLLFDNRDEYSGEIINETNYRLRMIDIYIDGGELILQKIASLSRWELMKKSPNSGLVIASEDPFSSLQAQAIPSLIPHRYLQSYLLKNPSADRVIINLV